MWPWGWLRWVWPEPRDGAVTDAFRRDRLARLAALVTVLGLACVFVFAKGTRFLMPGPLTSAHGAIANCNACHSNSGSSKVSWVHGLVAGDPIADSKSCLTCHKMPDTAFNAHGASTEVLMLSTKRLTKVAETTPVPQSARIQNTAFPTHEIAGRDIACATCHQEHRGANFQLNKISNEQCRSCHVVQFDSFDGNHPKFEAYPFKRRTRIVYDHAGHFGKHYPEVAKKDPAKRIPEACSTCHNSQGNKLVMAVAPFEQTCSGCHLNQITGKERAQGPKGVAFLSVPGLDVKTLKDKNADIGEWPEESEAALTPFMKVMISRTERGRALIKAVDTLNLQDLSGASDQQVKAVAKLAWEVKGLFHAMMKGKASDVLGDLSIGGGAKLSAGLVADLTASIPRDVVTSAQQQWLPNLATEMASRSDPKTQTLERQGAVVPNAASASPEEVFGSSDRPTRKVADNDGPKYAQSDESESGRLKLPSGTPRSIKADREGDGKGDAAKSKPAGDKGGGSAAAPEPGSGGAQDASEAAKAKPADGASPAPDAAKAAVQPAQGDPADQSDDLLFPTEAEQRAMKSGSKGAASGSNAGDQGTAKADGGSAAEAAAKPAAAAPADQPAAGSSAVAKPTRAQSAPVISIVSDVDPETWAEFGGWYRQDFAIYYRPTGHKDKFIYSWLFLTGPKAIKGDRKPEAAVFEALTNKDAQGACTKCHSVDDIQGKGRLVNFTPVSLGSKQGRFTAFVHEPHFGVMETRGANRGCLTCHNLEKDGGLEKDGAYLKSYEQGNPQEFVSNFGAVKKELCQGCHTSGKAQQDCTHCHNYHVNGVVTPIITTKLPIQ